MIDSKLNYKNSYDSSRVNHHALWHVALLKVSESIHHKSDWHTDLTGYLLQVSSFVVK